MRPRDDAERVISLCWWLLVAFSAVWLAATLARAQEPPTRKRAMWTSEGIADPGMPGAQPARRSSADQPQAVEGTGSQRSYSASEDGRAERVEGPRYLRAWRASSCGGGQRAKLRPAAEDKPSEPGNSLGWQPLWLARVCQYEADQRTEDCKAIWWVAKKRAAMAGEEPLDMLLRYSTMLRSRSARAKRIRAGVPPASLLVLAEELLRGEHADPCPSATHFGGRTDAARGRMVPAVCSARTANTFYRVASRPAPAP